ncbi:unnamed protein product [Lactuca virosa]|uniref:Uncharacterized protein n=1 Tax=Lactuca virosa TaxID=75947 RepID=A0AAU9M5L2_9ASTR|nr:unnamed protein product [Lactuca virosa]
MGPAWHLIYLPIGTGNNLRSHREPLPRSHSPTSPDSPPLDDHLSRRFYKVAPQENRRFSLSHVTSPDENHKKQRSPPQLITRSPIDHLLRSTKPQPRSVATCGKLQYIKKKRKKGLSQLLKPPFTTHCCHLQPNHHHWT